MTKQLLLLVFFFSISLSLCLGQNCVGGFTATNSANLDVDIVNQATGNYTHILYEYGDGQSAIVAGDHTYSYADAGVYEVCQSLIDTVNFTCIDLVCEVIYVGGATCSARFSWEEGGLDYDFENESLGDFDSISWDFGDSAFSTAFDPQHIYDSSGSYLVCLRLFENGVLCDSVCDSVQVQERDCEALFSYDQQGLTLFLTNESRGLMEDKVWSFGDGSSSSFVEDPRHDYVLPGTYTVRLRVSDSAETCVDVLKQEVVIKEDCYSQFFFEANSENQYSFEPITLEDYAYLSWDFGNGDVASEKRPKRTFIQAGEYEVCLYKYFTNDALCSYTCKTLIVSPVGIDDAVNKLGAEVFPNPSNGSFTLKWSGNDLLNSIEVFDLGGRKVFAHAQAVSSSAIIHTGLASGTYFMVLESEGSQQVLPLVIEN